MVSSIQNCFDIRATYAAFNTYNRCVTWIRDHSSHIYSKLADIVALARLHLLNTAYSVWTYKEWIIAGGVSAAVIGVAWLIINYIRNRPQYPTVNLRSTLNLAELTIQISKAEPLPPNVMLSFCVDTSSSMDGEREEAVKRGVNIVLDSAQKVVNATRGAKISIGINGFNNKARKIVKQTKLTSTATSPMLNIKNQLDNYRSNGGTNILAGLIESIKALETNLKIHKATLPVIILLSDGEDNLDSDHIASIHNKLNALQAQLFVIGIGDRHNKETLRNLASSKIFRGTYIDTTLGKDTIESAISKIYSQVISSYQNLELTSPQLPSGTWSVINTSILIENGQTKFVLGSLPEGETLKKYIKIHGDKLKEPLKLSTVSFNLAFQDTKGRKGIFTLQWNPKTTIDNQLITAALKAGV